MTVVATTTQFAFRLAILTLLDGLTEVLALKVAAGSNMGWRTPAIIANFARVATQRRSTV